MRKVRCLDMGWWNEITTVEQVLYLLAASSTILLLIQTVLSMVGLDSDADVLNEDLAHSGLTLTDSEPENEAAVRASGDDHLTSVRFRIFTIRGILSFFALGTWVTIVLFKATASWPVSFSVGAAAGILTMILIAKGFQLVMKPASDGAVEIKTAVGAVGEVYVTIPPKGEGKGKVSVLLQGAPRVYDAVAYEDKKIPTGRQVRVLDIAGRNMLLVESNESNPAARRTDVQHDGENT